jgi:hypothetical protein
MKTKIFFILLLTVNFCIAQNGNKKNEITIESAPGIIYEIGNGEVFESAIKIKFAKNSKEGISAETKYLENKYGVLNIDWRPFGNEFYKVKKKQYNVIHITIYDKEDKAKEEFKTIYFDITDCYEN